MNNLENKKIVTKIPADARKASRVEPGRKLKVAAYCRVSTDDEDQLNSYRVQKDYYSKHIISNDNWEFAGVYADEGITGTQVKKRDDFLRMIKDCEKGKIDMILTKSVSRFARNIVDSITFVRKLKAMGISIYFEEQNIDSLKEDSETYIGIYSVMAQSESENISANVKWGISKRMENGTYCCNMNMFGYRRDKITKKVYIIPEEAEVVRTIFRYFLDGMSIYQIKHFLEDSGFKTFSGGDTWHKTTILNMLQNEKYCGDIMYQKTYCVDCISKKKKVNNGQKARYLVQDDHEAIITRDVFYAVQAEIAKRNTERKKSELFSTTKGRYSGKYALSELLVCGCCTGHYRRKTVKKKDGVMHYWRCSSRLEHADKYCSNSIGLEEDAVKDAVCRALSRVLKRREKGYEVVNSHLIYAASADERSEDMYFIDKGIRDEEQRIMDLSKLARESGNNQEKFEAAIADCTKRIKILREKKEQVIRQLNFNEEAKREMDRIKAYLAEDRAVVDKFDDSTVRRLVNQIVVSEDLKLTIYIKGGYEIEEQYLPRPKSA